jgi:DivIVA domain-containing protein
VALERQSIEKKDFPIGRRGYDPDAVDAHLRTVADEIDELKRSSRRRSETLASAASEQVRAIVEAAETSAAEIQRQAEDDAREIRAEADSEARSRREEAETQARDYVGRVSESTTGMLQRVDAMENELGALLEALRTGANRLNADLQLLEGNIGEVREAVVPRPRFEPEPPAPPAAAAAEPAPTPPPPPVVTPLPPDPAPAEPALADVADELDEPEAPEAGSESAAGGDDEGARLIALNMALNGTPREETERYLEENFELSDRQALLDEVYASVEG